jgi:putative NADH-flavin reductase
MKIAVVGATGATGRRVVKHALAQGHLVTAVARHPERLSFADRLSFVPGDVLSPGGLTGALDGVEAVISCIGPEKNLSPGTLMSVGVASILTECKRANVRRFILQSGIGLSDGRELSWPNRFVVRVSGRIFTAAVADKAVAERLTQKIDMEWVIVRPVVLADKPAKGSYSAGPLARVAPLVPLSFDDCADCLLRAAINEPNWIGKIVNVGS